MVAIRGDLSLLEHATLSHGPHPGREGVCAMELLSLIVTGEKTDSTPPCLSSCLGLLVNLNDAGGWRDDEHRSSTLLPYFPRLMRLDRDAERDRERALRLVDYAVRRSAPEALDAAARALDGIRLTEHGAEMRRRAEGLRKLAPVDSPDAARDASAASWAGSAASWAASAAARAASDAARDASYASWAASHASWAASDAARDASAAAWAASYAARAASAAARAASYASRAASAAAWAASAAAWAEAIERHARGLLDALLAGEALW